MAGCLMQKSAKTCKSLGAQLSVIKPDSYFILRWYNTTFEWCCQIWLRGWQMDGSRCLAEKGRGRYLDRKLDPGVRAFV